MPELPEIEVYLESLRLRIVGQPLEAARIGSPFLLHRGAAARELFVKGCSAKVHLARERTLVHYL